MMRQRMEQGNLISRARRSVFIICMAICVAVLPSCGDSGDHDTPAAFFDAEQQETYPPAAFSAAEQQKMTTVVQNAIKKGDIPGIIVGVWAGNKEWILEKGVSDIETSSPIQWTMNVRIGSITKSFTATIILQLADEGRLSLDDPVSKYTDGIPNGSAVSIRQLLNMSSGLFSFTDIDGFEYEMTHQLLKQWTPDELIALGVNNPKNPVFAPGQGFNYSNTNYMILGKVIEKVTGNSVTNEIQNRISRPLSLSSTYMPDTASMPPNSTRGYYYDIKNGGSYIDVTTEEARYFAWTAGGMISNLKEIRKYVKALGNGDLISSKMRTEQQNLNPFSKFEDRYGYGLGVSYVNGYIGHNGSIPGWNSSAYHHPKKNITIIVLANKWKISNLTLGTDTIFISLGKIVTPELDWSGLDQ